MFESYQLAKNHKQNKMLSLATMTNLTKLLQKRPCNVLEPDLTYARTRLDLLWDGLRLGLKIHKNDEILFEPIDNFDNAVHEIIELSKLFEQTCPYRNVMSLRFRQSHTGTLGLWLDASRDGLREIKKHHMGWVKNLLDQNIVIEAGQRQEEWVYDSDNAQIKSTKTKMRPWLASYNIEQQPIALASSIASFSQPGPLANQTLIHAGFELLNTHLSELESLDWAEWGAGNGNLSVAFCSLLNQKHAWISEPDPRAYAALEHNHNLFFSDAQIERTAAIRAPKNFDLWLLDPPRSGFSELIKSLEPHQKPKNILIYHCAQSGLLKDQAALTQQHYSLKDWIFCNVFPGSPHSETVSLWCL